MRNILGYTYFFRFMLLWSCGEAQAATVYFAGGNGTVSWFSPDAWSNGTLPQYDDIVIIDGRGSATSVHIVIDVESPTAVEIGRLLLRNATLSIGESATLSVLNTNASEPSEIRDSSRLRLLDDATLRMPSVECGGNNTLHACLRDHGALLDVSKESSIEFDIFLSTFESSEATLTGGLTMIRGAGSFFSLRSAVNTIQDAHIVVTEQARMEVVYEYDSMEEFSVNLHDSTVHVDVSSSLFIGYNKALPLGGDCESSLVKNSSLLLLSNFSTSLEVIECDFCVDGVVELRPLPCFKGEHVDDDRVRQSGVLDFRDSRLRFRGYTFVGAGGALSFSPNTHGSTSRFSHTALYIGGDTKVFVWGGSVLEFSDELTLRGCGAFSVESSVVAVVDTLDSSTFDDELSEAAALALAALVHTCTEADASSVWKLPHIITVESEFMLQPSGGHLRLLALDTSSSHFLVDTSRYAINEYYNTVFPLVVGDHTFTEPVFFHIGQSVLTAYRNSTTGLIYSSATLRFEHYLSHIIVARSTKTGNSQVFLKHVELVMINCTFLLGSTNETRAVVTNPPSRLNVDGAITVAGARGRFVLGAADEEHGSSVFYVLLTTATSFVAVRDGATFGNMVRHDDGNHVLPNESLFSPHWRLDRGQAGAESALRIESGGELLYHGTDFVTLRINYSNDRFTIDMTDASMHLYAEAKVEVLPLAFGLRNTFMRSVAFIHDASTLIMAEATATLVDFSVIGDGSNGANYGRFEALSDFYVYESMSVRGVEFITYNLLYDVAENSFTLYANTSVEIVDYAFMESFFFISPDFLDNKFESGTAPSVYFRNSDPLVSHRLRSGWFAGTVHIYLDCVALVDGTVEMSHAILHVLPSGWLRIEPAGSIGYATHELLDALLSVEGGRVSAVSDDTLVQIGVPWQVFDGAVLERVELLGPYGRCLDCTLRNVTFRGVADIDAAASNEAMIIGGGRCDQKTTAEWKAHSTFLASLRAEYDTWSAPCTAYACCVRVSNVGGGLTFNDGTGGMVLGGGVSSRQLTVDEFDENSFFIDIRSPPSDSLFWAFPVAIPLMTIDNGIRVVTSSPLPRLPRYISSLALHRGDEFGMNDTLAMWDFFGPYFGSSFVMGCHVRLHGFFTSDIYWNPNYLEPAIVEFGSDVEAPLNDLSAEHNVVLMARRGSSLRTKGSSTVSPDIDEALDMFVEDSLMLVNDSSFTASWGMDVEVRGGHLHINANLFTYGRWVIETGGTLTIDTDSAVSGNSLSSVVVRGGGRLVFAAGTTMSNVDLFMEHGSLLVLPGAGGVTISGDMVVLDGAHIIQLYGDGQRVVDGNVTVAEPRLHVNGAVTIGANVAVSRVHVDANVPALPAAMSLLIVGSDLVGCNSSVGERFVCDESGLTFIGDVDHVTCPSVPALVTRDNCVACVSATSTACAYAIHQVSEASFVGVCMGGSSLDGPFSHAFGVANATLYDWSATVGNCFVMAQPRCHARTAVKCEANGGAVAAFEFDETLDSHARCKWCQKDVLAGIPRCLTQFETADGLCADAETTSTAVAEAIATTTNATQSTAAQTSAHTTTAPQAQAATTDKTNAGTLDLAVTEPTGDAWVWGVIGGLGALLVLVIATALLCVFVPFGNRRRRKTGGSTGRDEGATTLTSLSGDGHASSLPSGVEYAPMPMLTGSESGAYAEGELEPHAGSGLGTDTEYASGELAAPRLLQSTGDEYASGDMAAPRLVRTDSEYKAASGMFFTNSSGSSAYAQGELGADSTVSVYTPAADILAKASGGGEAVEEYETTNLGA